MELVSKIGGERMLLTAKVLVPDKRESNAELYCDPDAESVGNVADIVKKL